MKIQSSEVLLSGQHQSVQKHSKSETLRAWIGNQRPDFEGRGQAPSVRDNVDLSTQARTAARTEVAGQSAKAGGIDPDEALENDPRAMLIRMMVEALTGEKIQVRRLEKIEQNAPVSAPQNPNPPSGAPQGEAPQPAGFGVEYDARESHYEAESSRFSAQGVVRTADGKEINFALHLSMERVFAREESVSLRLGDAARQMKDPLVINFGGTAAQLTSAKFSFDIDSDGSAEPVSFVAPGSAFIALDRNGDGKINDGSELFGAQSGDGFQDLAAFDEDRNGWIDDNDAIFAQLQAWSKDEQGNDTLSSLKDRGVGALFLGRTATPFEIRTGDNDALGAVRSSGVYLNENGSAGTLQQIDLAV
jgi:hypothetical protein